MTKDEQITSLTDEVKNLKGELEKEQGKTAAAIQALATSNEVIKRQETTISQLNELIETLSAADPEATEAKKADSGLEFKHEGKLYRLNEPADRAIILPGIGSITAAEAVKNTDAIAYLVEREIAEAL